MVLGERRLPRRPALIAGETTASYLMRLARSHHWSFGDLARHLGGPPGLGEVDAGRAEVWLGPVAQERLVVVTGRTRRQLEQALPSLAQSSISPRAHRQVQVREYASQGRPIRACALCVAGRAPGTVWRADGEAWLVCRRHQRFMGGEQGVEQVSVRAVPEVADAHERRLRLRRTTGPYARALFADAWQVAGYWWQCRQMAFGGEWRQRAKALGWQRADPAWVRMLVYPEAVTVAEAMTVRERQRAHGRSFAGGPAGWSTGAWVAWVGQRLGLEEGMARGGDRALRAWLMAHRNTVPVVERLAMPQPPAGYRSWPLQMLAPHREVSHGEVEELSCLPWRLGTPVTSTVPGG